MEKLQLCMREQVPVLSGVRNLEAITDLFMQHTFSTTVGITSPSSQRQRLVKLLLTLGILAAPNSVARGAHWLVKYAKSHVFGGFEADFL